MPVSDIGTVAVTGLSTFIGRHTVERLLLRAPKLRIVGIDWRRPYRFDERVHFHRVDLTEPVAGSQVAEVLRRERVDALLHAAFRTRPTADLETDHELETIGSLHVLNACAAAKIRRLVWASTTMTYGPWADNPNYLRETHPLRAHPDAHNVRNRAEAESLLEEWRVRHPDTEVTVLRPCWIMGPTHFDAVSNYFSRPVVPKVMGFDPLLQFVHENDCLDAFERALLAPHPGVFNIVGTGVLPLSTILRIAGKRILPLPSGLLYRLAYYPSGRTGDPPAGFYDYLRYLWLADGRRGWEAFGEPAYSTKEAWMSFVSSRRMQRYR